MEMTCEGCANAAKRVLGKKGGILSLRVTKPTILVSDQVRHKTGCRVIEEHYMLEILGIIKGREGIVLSE